MTDTAYCTLCCITGLIRADHFFPSYESSVVFGDDLEAIHSHATPQVKKVACAVPLEDSWSLFHWLELVAAASL